MGLGGDENFYYQLLVHWASSLASHTSTVVTWMSKYKSWYYFVLETYRNRFEELLAVIDNVAFRNMDERLFFYLKRYTETNHCNTISLSHQQIADELNSSREVISRLLKKMEQRRLVTLNRNLIELQVNAAW